MKLKQLYLNFKRLLRHSWFSAADAKRAVPLAVQQRLQAQIKASEALHSGQIRLCVEAALPLGYIWRGLAARARAVTLFGKLRVWDTERNNGVLIYVLLAERKIEIVADRGLANHVPATYWQSVINEMRKAFQTQEFESGLTFAIEQVSGQLTTYFPVLGAHVNELPDAPLVQ